jgi:hypothetical protein
LPIESQSSTGDGKGGGRDTSPYKEERARLRSLRASALLTALEPTKIGIYFAGEGAGAADGTVSISLPVKTGAECGTPSGDPPACSTVTA